jgi:hypothetical protein
LVGVSVVGIVSGPWLVDGGALGVVGDWTGLGDWTVLGDRTGCGAVAVGFEPCASVVPLPLPGAVPLPLAVPLPAGEAEEVLTARAD